MHIANRHSSPAARGCLVATLLVFALPGASQALADEPGALDGLDKAPASYERPEADPSEDAESQKEGDRDTRPNGQKNGQVEEADQTTNNGPSMDGWSGDGDEEPEAKDYLDRAITLMRERLATADSGDERYPVLLSRLADMLWQRARRQRLDGFAALQRARRAEDEGSAEDGRQEREQHDHLLAAADEDLEESAGLWLRIGEEYPLYEDADAALFRLAQALVELGDPATAREQYQALIAEHPASRFAATAQVSLADDSFGRLEDPALALEQYEAALQLLDDDATRAYAQYKAAWCLINLEEPARAIGRFEKALELAEAAGDDSLRGASLREIVQALAIWDEASPRRAESYLRKLTKSTAELRDTRERLAVAYEETGKPAEANAVYDELIEDSGKHWRSVDYQRRIVANIEYFQAPEESAAELVRTYRLMERARNESWPADGVSTEEVEQKLGALTRELAAFFHYTAQVSKDLTYYALAYTAYQHYFAGFPESAMADAELNYWYAELLYWKDHYARAATHYQRVVALDPDGKRAEDAAYGAVIGRYKLIEKGDECPPIPVAPEPAAGEERQWPRFDLQACYVDFVEAADGYADQFPAERRAPDIAYEAARVFYDHNQFEQAAARFADVAERWPSHRLGLVAANLHLDSLVLLERYNELQNVVSAYQNNETLNREPLTSVLDVLEQQLAFKACTELEAGAEWEKAAICFESHAETWPESEYAARALWSASVDWENSAQVGRAIEARISLLERHGDGELAPRALYNIAASYHGLAVFSEAARFYELFAEQYPDDVDACRRGVPYEKESNKRGSNKRGARGEASTRSSNPEENEATAPCARTALSNAAAFRAGLGQVDHAVKDYDAYLARFAASQEERAKLSTSVGRLLVDHGRHREAVERMEEMVDSFPGHSPWQVVLQTQLGRARAGLDQPRLALKHWEEADEHFGSKRLHKNLAAGSDTMRQQVTDAAAEARFQQGEAAYLDAVQLVLVPEGTSPRRLEKTLQKRLRQKAAEMEHAEEILQSVVADFRSPRWGLAALARIGMMYEDLANQLVQSPCPPRLTEDQCLIYQDQLFEFADRFEKKAIDLFVKTVELAGELGWFTEFTSQARERLFRLQPEQYRSASEVLGQPGFQTREFHRAPLATDITAAHSQAPTEPGPTAPFATDPGGR